MLIGTNKILSKKDKQVMDFIEKYGGLTIRQCAKLFYSSGEFSYDSARMKLKRLDKDFGLLDTKKDPYLNELAYFFKTKDVSTHRLALLNLYAEFLNYKIQVTHFQTERSYLDGKRRSDGFIGWNNQYGEPTAAFVEVVMYSGLDIKKYEQLYDSNEYQNKYGIFPNVIVLSETPKKIKSDNFEVINMNLKCTDFMEKVMTL